MSQSNLEKVAAKLAYRAVTQRAQGRFTKQAGTGEDIMKYLSTPAGRYLLGGLGGAGLGALVGAAQPKRRGRNALYYGAMGGLGGLGLAGLLNSVGSGDPKAPKKEDPAGANRYRAVMDNPNSTTGQKWRAAVTNPLDAASDAGVGLADATEAAGDLYGNYVYPAIYNGTTAVIENTPKLVDNAAKAYMKHIYNPIYDATPGIVDRASKAYTENVYNPIFNATGQALETTGNALDAAQKGVSGAVNDARNVADAVSKTPGHQFVEDYLTFGQQNLENAATGLNNARLSAGKALGENVLYPVAKGVYNWWNRNR